MTTKNIYATDRKGKRIVIGNTVKSKHGKLYKVVDFLCDIDIMNEAENVLVKVVPVEDNSIYRIDRELEVV